MPKLGVVIADTTEHRMYTIQENIKRGRRRKKRGERVRKEEEHKKTRLFVESLTVQRSK